MSISTPLPYSLSQFDYQLPTDLIAKEPSEPRDHSRLLLLQRDDHQNITTPPLSDHFFWQLPDLLPPHSLIVRNNSKVFPARVHGQKSSGGQVEILILNWTATESGCLINCLTKPGLKQGQAVSITTGITESAITGYCRQVNDYQRQIELPLTIDQLVAWLNKVGETPLPPYIHNQLTETERRQKYQTIYAKPIGSAAAPTAGLHFTPELDARLKAAHHQLVDITLHVGLGTFLPVQSQQITQGKLHQEGMIISPEAAAKINHAKAIGQPVIAVGTTTTRVLEAAAAAGRGRLEPQISTTDLFIQPGFKFQVVDGLITNFHLPKSSLLFLVSAFCSWPQTSMRFTEFKDSIVGQGYQHAIANNYRFFSFGDAMLIL